MKITHKNMVGMTDEEYDRLEKVRDNRGLRTIADTIRVCIAETYRKDFPAYIHSKPPRQTPEERAINQTITEETKQQIKDKKAYDVQKDICDRLQGEEIDGRCHYLTYGIYPGNIVESRKVDEPFEVLKEAFIDLQYTDLFNQTGFEVKEQIIKLLKKDK